MIWELHRRALEPVNTNSALVKTNKALATIDQGFGSIHSARAYWELTWQTHPMLAGFRYLDNDQPVDLYHAGTY